MQFNNEILWRLMLIVILLALPFSAYSQDPGYLWNVTDSGDTLRYVNIFSSDAQQAESAFPKYMTRQEFRLFLQSTHLPQDSIAYQPNVEHLLQFFPGNRDYIKPLEPQYKNIWKPVLAATVSGALSAYFKLEANAAYERYNRSIDVNTIDKYYKLTRKYDTYSAISFVCLQASFGWLSYKLLR